MDYFAINNNSYFKHFGRKGQKWGDRNGPPYPLDYSKLSSEERAADKERAIAVGDVETAAYKRNRDYFTKQDLDNLINKYTTNQRLDELLSAENSKNLDKKIKKAEKAIKIVGTVSSGFKVASDLTSNVNSLMNNIDKMTKNTLTETIDVTYDEKQHKKTIIKNDKRTGIKTTNISEYWTDEQKAKKALEDKQKEKERADKKAQNPTSISNIIRDYGNNYIQVQDKDPATGANRTTYTIIDPNKPMKRKK